MISHHGSNGLGKDSLFDSTPTTGNNNLNLPSTQFGNNNNYGASSINQPNGLNNIQNGNSYGQSGSIALENNKNYGQSNIVASTLAPVLNNNLPLGNNNNNYGGSLLNQPSAN